MKEKISINKYWQILCGMIYPMSSVDFVLPAGQAMGFWFCHWHPSNDRLDPRRQTSKVGQPVMLCHCLSCLSIYVTVGHGYHFMSQSVMAVTLSQSVIAFTLCYTVCHDCHFMSQSVMAITLWHSLLCGILVRLYKKRFQNCIEKLVHQYTGIQYITLGGIWGCSLQGLIPVWFLTTVLGLLSLITCVLSVFCSFTTSYTVNIVGGVPQKIPVISRSKEEEVLPQVEKDQVSIESVCKRPDLDCLPDAHRATHLVQLWSNQTGCVAWSGLGRESRLERLQRLFLVWMRAQLYRHKGGEI